MMNTKFRIAVTTAVWGGGYSRRVHRAFNCTLSVLFVKLEGEYIASVCLFTDVKYFIISISKTRNSSL